MNKLTAGFNPSTHLPRGENNERNRRKTVARRLRNQEYMLTIPREICEACGYTNKEKPWHFDFHHKDMTKKKYNIGRLWAKNVTLKQIREELNKCILLCKFCHADQIHKEKPYNNKVVQ